MDKRPTGRLCGLCGKRAIRQRSKGELCWKCSQEDRMTPSMALLMADEKWYAEREARMQAMMVRAAAGVPLCERGG